MGMLIPETGTIFWMLISFLTVFFLLRKFAWKPIMNALKDRDLSIARALKSAERAKEEMQRLEADNQVIKEQARKERDAILKEARDLKDQILNEAKQKASSEADNIIEAAKSVIQKEKDVAMKEIKEQLAILSVSIAEKLLQEKLSDDKENKELIDKLLREVKIN